MEQQNKKSKVTTKLVEDPRITQETSHSYIKEILNKGRSYFDSILSSEKNEEKTKPLETINTILKRWGFQELPITQANTKYLIHKEKVLIIHFDNTSLQPVITIEPFLLYENGNLAKLTPSFDHLSSAISIRPHALKDDIEQSLFDHLKRYFREGTKIHISNSKDSRFVWSSQTQYRKLFEYTFHMQKEYIDHAEELQPIMRKENILRFLRKQQCGLITIGHSIIAGKKYLNMDSFLEFDIFFDPNKEISTHEVGFDTVTVAFSKYTTVYNHDHTQKKRLMETPYNTLAAENYLKDNTLKGVYFDINADILKKLLTDWWSGWKSYTK